jgi:hypothetical protein
MSWKKRIRRISRITNEWIDLIVVMNALPHFDVEIVDGYQNQLAVYESEVDNIYAEACELFVNRISNQKMIIDIFRSLNGILPFDDIVMYPRNSPESIRALNESDDFPHMNQFISEYYRMIDELLIPQTIQNYVDTVLVFAELSPISADNVCDILSYTIDTDLITKYEVDCIVYRTM